MRTRRQILELIRFLPLVCFTIPSAAAETSKTTGFVGKLEKGIPQRIVLYGTSLTAEGPWVGQLRKTVDGKYPGLATWINSGGSGKASDWGLKNLKAKVIDQKPDVVFVEFSMNDAAPKLKVSREQARENLSKMVAKIRGAHPHCEIILQLMNPADVGEGGNLSPRPDLRFYQNDYRDFAAANGLLCVDHFPAFQALLDKGSDAYRVYVPDGVHPNAEGCARFLTPTLLQTLGIVQQDAD